MITAIMNRPPINPAARGFHVIYRENETNYCPGCGRTHWLIGRVTAECAFCATALPLQDTRHGLEPVVTYRGKLR